MKRRDCFAIIESLEQMCHAGKAATAYYFKVCQNDPGVMGKVSFRHRDIRDCHSDLEDTYIVRIFAEFEGQLRDCWKNHFGRPTNPWMKDLVDSVAGRCSTPVGVVKEVHKVRDYRNSLIHGGTAVPVMLADSRKYLLKYLGDLPHVWLYRNI